MDTRITAFGYTWIAARENQAAGQTAPAAAMTGRTKSPGHKANILSADVNEIRVRYGYAGASTYKHYWVEDLRRRPGVYPIVINRQAAKTTSASVSHYVYGGDRAEQMRLSKDGTC